VTAFSLEKLQVFVQPGQVQYKIFSKAEVKNPNINSTGSLEREGMTFFLWF